jgi:hypothetical protein
MKTVAIFYEKETDDNRYLEKKVLERLCVETTKEEHEKLLSRMEEYNKALSICLWLEDDEAAKVVKKWKEYETAYRRA